LIEEHALAGVECRDPVHLIAGKREVEDVEILGDAVRSDRLGDRHDVALEQPAKRYLRDRFGVALGDPGQLRVGEEPVLAFGERPPRLDLDPCSRATV
jgi:hypothetical protein